MSKKRPMTKEEKAYIEAASQFGCAACGAKPTEWHHLPMARIENAHACGFPLCFEHHQGKEFIGQSIHYDKLLFEKNHNTELRLLQKTILRVFSRSIPF